MEANVAMISCPSCGVEVDASARVCPACQFPLDGGAQPFVKGHILEGRYRIDGEIGRGGMGVVYRGTDLTLKRLVAIKAVLTNLADKGVLLRFMHEARALASVEHPGLVPVYAVGQEGGVYYMVMKLLSGHTLADIIKGHGRLEEVTVRKMVVEVCDALEALHDAGLLHRDLKPANLMMGSNGRFTVMDLGIVQNIGDDAEGVRAAAMGTPKYMPPEMYSNLEVDGRADLYSLGIIAYHALTGEPPFDGPTPMAILYRQAHESAPPLITVNSEVSRAFSDIVERVMAKDPKVRYDDARSLAEVVRMAPVGRRPEKLQSVGLFIALMVFGALAGSIFFLSDETTNAGNRMESQTPIKVQAPVITIVEAPQNKVPPKPLAPPAPPPKPQTVELVIISSPAGASVFEGSKKLGLTPLTLEREQSGANRLSLTIKKQDYSSRKLRAALDEDQTLRVKLKPDFEAVPFDP